MTSFEALYGTPPSIPSYLAGGTKITVLDEVLTHRQLLLNKLKENLAGVCHRMKQAADKHRTELPFEVGDLVYLQLQPYRQLSVASRRSQKPARRYFGPFKVLWRIGTVAYELDLLAMAKIHPVFHVSLSSLQGAT